MGEIRVGISGWTYPPWRKSFYPRGLTQKRELEYASRQFSTIEINGAFYSLQRPTAFQHWYEQAPEDFIYSIKGGRFITHLRRLREVDQPLANFFASGILALREKLGPILWQFPPSMKFDPVRFEAFFQKLPRTTREAATIAEHHNAWMEGRVFLEPGPSHPVRHCVEIRNESFQTPEFVKLLRAYDIGLVIADTAGKWPMIEETTSDFVYIRLHGMGQMYVGGYTDAALEDWATKIRRWKRGRDVYVYFDNDVKVRAPFDAMALAHKLGTFEPALPVSKYRAPKVMPTPIRAGGGTGWRLKKKAA
ncbi:MAG: DUF72 domain-containing protein [Bdellovibrionota bacterium]